MAQNTKIEWTEATWNPVRGCSRVSQGCRNCYAERVAARFSGTGQPYEGLAVMKSDGPHWTGKVQLVEERLQDPLRWKKPRRIFVNSMSDLFHEALSDEAIDRVFAVMALASQHTFQVLTKRAERMLAYVGLAGRRSEISESASIEAFDEWTVKGRSGRIPANASYDKGTEEMGSAHMRVAFDWPLPNVWLGVSCEDQKTADERIPLLLQTPAAVRWISAEPLLGEINIGPFVAEKTSTAYRMLSRHYKGDGSFDPKGTQPEHKFQLKNPVPLNWVVVGGESGPNARPMHPDWARSLRDQCQAAGVPFFFKQWGRWSPHCNHDGSEASGLSERPTKLMNAEGCTDEAYLAWQGGGEVFYGLGKRAAGRLLDGREWNEYPQHEFAATAA